MVNCVTTVMLHSLSTLVTTRVFSVPTDNTLECKTPEFIKPLHDVETFIGNSVKFRCKVKGYPHPKVLWFKDGKRLKPSDVVKMGETSFQLIYKEHILLHDII